MHIQVILALPNMQATRMHIYHHCAILSVLLLPTRTTYMVLNIEQPQQPACLYFEGGRTQFNNTYKLLWLAE